eukprot:g11909.t1
MTAADGGDTACEMAVKPVLISDDKLKDAQDFNMAPAVTANGEDALGDGENSGGSSGAKRRVAVYDQCDSALQQYFEQIGRFAARRPWTLIVATIFIAIAFSAGMSVAEQEERPERLWIPEDAQALDDVSWVDDQWPGLTSANRALTRCIEKKFL